ncbi:MAG TPA: ATP phosphoribosyltransferase regulatory subunit, partial [Rhizomicrobium sp.]
TLSESEARPAFEGLMEMIGKTPLGGRTREEIVDRLIEQAADAAALKLDPWIANTLAKLLAVSGPATQSIDKIRALAKSAGVSLEAPLKAMTARLATLKSLGVDPKQVSFAARFGRNMEYYTGFVFELWARDAEGPVQVAGGGRYDTLMEQLGSKKHIPAIGCAIRTERVLAAIAAQGKAKR